MPPRPDPSCCPLYHQAVELLGRRWTGAIVEVLLEGGPQRFGEIAGAVPALSDRLLSQRLKDLELRGVVARAPDPGPPPCVRYALTPMGEGLRPAVTALKRWGREWLDAPPDAPSGDPGQLDTSASTFRRA